jgi:hypothetical protein
MTETQGGLGRRRLFCDIVLGGLMAVDAFREVTSERPVRHPGLPDADTDDLRTVRQFLTSLLSA